MSEVTKRVILDMDLCIGCRSCAAACFYGQKDMPIVNFGTIPQATVPVICRQCEEPACVDACPNEAMQRDELGVVWRSLFRCTGCGSCALACPFGVIPTEPNKHQIAKCDLCEDWVSAGRPPRCVAACTSGALRFAEAPELAEEQLLLLSGRAVGRSPMKRRM